MAAFLVEVLLALQEREFQKKKQLSPYTFFYYVAGVSAAVCVLVLTLPKKH